MKNSGTKVLNTTYRIKNKHKFDRRTICQLCILGASITLMTGCTSLGSHGGSVAKRSVKLSNGLQQAFALPSDQANRLSPMIIQSGDQHQVDPRLISAIIRQESNFNRMARSPTGAIGLGQIIPSYWAAVCGNDLYNENTNINCTARILSNYYDQGGSWKKAIAYYNVGPTGYQSSFWTRWKVRKYVKSVKNFEKELKRSL